MPEANSQAGRRKLFSRIGSDAESTESSRRRHLKASIQVIVKPDLYEPGLLPQHKSNFTEDVSVDDSKGDTSPLGEGACARDILRRNSTLTASLSARKRRDAPGDGKMVSCGVASDREFGMTSRRRYRTVDAEHFRQFDPAKFKKSSPSNASDPKEHTEESSRSEVVCRNALQTAARTSRSLALKRDPKVEMEAGRQTTPEVPVPLEKKENMERIPPTKIVPTASTQATVQQRPLSHNTAKATSHQGDSNPNSANCKSTLKETSTTRVGNPRQEPSGLAERVSKARGKASDRYDDEEYVEDLAQLDVLLHYVNNLSASLEFLDWEKNKRISTDLVPTLLDIYDALYAKLADEPEGRTPRSTDASDVNETAPAAADDSSHQGRKLCALSNSKTVDRTNSSKAALGKTVQESPISASSDKRIDGKIKPSSHSLNENELPPEGAILNDSESNLGVDDPNYSALRESENALMGSAVSVNHSAERRVREASPQSAPVAKPSSAVTIISEAQDSVEETLSPSLSVPRQMVHPSIAHIPPRSPVHPRRASPPSEQDGTPISDSASLNVNPKHISNNSMSTAAVRPLSSVSSSSSSSSNSLRRGHAGVNTSYLASVESLVEADEEAEASVTSGRRREKSLKVRRDFRGHFSRPGSCDSGVVQCHGFVALAAAPAASTAPATGPHHHQYPHHMLQRHHLHHPAYDEGKPLSHMDLLVMEVLDTEASYVHGLMEVIQGYLEPWLRGEDRGVSPLQATELFSNLTEIHDFNRLLLKELQWCGVDPVMLARIFVRNNAGFSIYTQYCTHYPRTVSLLTELMSNAESVSCFRQRQQALGHTLPLGSYLLKPVQRILKYHLLLENILKNFDRESNIDGYNVILNARNAMTGMAHHINDMKRKHEHCVRVQEIQSLLYGWQGADLTTFGELAAEGTFRIVSAKGIRHVFLFSKMLLICKKKVENILMYKTHIMCSNLMLIESIPREPLCFQVIPFDNPRLQYTLQARNREHKHEWTQQLKRLILENYSAEIPPHARQLVMELGRAKQDEVLPLSGSSGGRRQVASSGPEYLQKRRRRGRRASEVPSTPTGGGARLRLRRLSKDSVESGRSRSASRGRDTEDDEDTQRSLLPLTDKPKLRLSMWRRRSEPNVPKNSHSLDAPCTPPTPSVYSTAPTTPTHHPDDALTPDGTQVADLTQHSSDLLDTPEVLVVPCLPEHCSPTRLSFSGRCSVALQPPHSAELSAHPTVYVQVDSLSISECERDSGLSQSKAGDDDDGESTQENLEEIVSQLLQHNLHLQKLLLSKHRRGLLSRKRSRGLSGHVSNTASETSDTENDDVISHDSGLPITSINSMNSINHVLPSPETSNSLSATNRIPNNNPPDPPSTSTDSNKCHQDYVEFYFDRSQKKRREPGDYYSNKGDSAVRENGSSSEGTSVYSSAASISQKDSSGKSIISEPSNDHNTKSSDYNVRPASICRKSISSNDNLGHVWNARVGGAPELRFNDNTSANSNCNARHSSESTEKNLTQTAEDASLIVRRDQSSSSRTSLDKTDINVRLRDAPPEGASNHSIDSKDRRVTIAVYDNAGEGIADHQSDKCSVSTSSTLNASSFNESTVCDEQFTDCSESVQLEDSFNVHPDHKIYTSAILSRNSLKNVMNKLVSARKSSAQDDTVINVSSNVDSTTTDKTPGKLVYSMARQCTKTLKERIKQIRSEEESCTLANSKSSTSNRPLITGPVKSVGCEKSKRALQEINSLSQYKQGSSSIGEKLATNCITSLKIDPSSVSDGTKLEKTQTIFSDDALTAEKTCTNTSPSDTLNGLEDLNLDDSSGSLEEFEDDNSGGDSYYERSFEVIEDMLENDLFRDSAIYSDPEDPDSKISVSDLTRNLPRSVLNRVSKSPSVRSDRSNYSGKNSLPRKSQSVKSVLNKCEFAQEQAARDSVCQGENEVTCDSVVSGDVVDCSPEKSLSSAVREQDGSAAHFDAKPNSPSNNDECSSGLDQGASDSNILKKNDGSSDSSNLNETEKEFSNVSHTNKLDSEAISSESSTAVEREQTLNTLYEDSNVLADDITQAKEQSSQNDANSALNSPNNASVSSTSSSRKKTPPPVPAKPGVCTRASRHCGSKILSQLKSLEECSKFSKTSNCSVVELDGLKSLDERRKELKSSTEGNRNVDETKPDKSNQPSTQGNIDSSLSPTNYQEGNEMEKKKVPSSPLMSVRSFVSRNVASVTTSLRSSRAPTRQTTALTSASEANKLPPVISSAKIFRGSSEEETCVSGEKLNKGIVHTRSPAHNISITRRKSIKTIGNYISKFNSRSSSVPPKLHERFESRQSSLPSERLNGDESDSGTELPSNTNKSNEKNDAEKGISSSVSFPESFESSNLCSLPCESAQFPECIGGPQSLPSPNLDSDDSSSSGGVIIEKRRPKGWVRHVVGRLQQSEVSQRKAKVINVGDVESGT